MEIGWTKPKEAPVDWDDAKIKAANFNSRALNAIFSAVLNEEFKKISSTETAKEAWTIFQTRVVNFIQCSTRANDQNNNEETDS